MGDNVSTLFVAVAFYAPVVVVVIGNLIFGILAVTKKIVPIYSVFGNRSAVGRPATIIGVTLLIGGLLAPFTLAIGGYISVMISILIGLLMESDVKQADPNSENRAARRVGDFMVESPSGLPPQSPRPAPFDAGWGSAPIGTGLPESPAKPSSFSGNNAQPGQRISGPSATRPVGGRPVSENPALMQKPARSDAPPASPYRLGDRRVQQDTWSPIGQESLTPPVKSTKTPLAPSRPTPAVTSIPSTVKVPDQNKPSPSVLSATDLTSHTWLEVIKGNISQTMIPIPGEKFMIGRGREADLQLLDAKISRRHALLRYASGNWYIQDPGSTSGIIVNGERVRATRLKTGDKIQIINYLFVFRTDPA